jgi:hypothetical protein
MPADGVVQGLCQFIQSDARGSLDKPNLACTETLKGSEARFDALSFDEEVIVRRSSSVQNF